jgi:RHS repeat-associated protein
MKAKIFYLLAVVGLSLPQLLKAQMVVSPTSSENYVITNNILKEGVKTSSDVASLSNGEKTTSIDYMDGLLRTKQSIVVSASAQANDVVSHHIYDAMGRANKVYLPFTKGSNKGAYINDPVTELNAFYSGESRPFSEHIYEAQAVKTYGPGSDWHANSKYSKKEVAYYLSTDNVYRWSLDAAGNPVKGAAYGNGDLAKAIATDEDGKQVISYADQFGNQVCKRAGGTDTYYIYDDYSNLVYVLPPKLVNSYSAEKLQDLAFRYVYDEKNRLIEEWVPGIEPSFYVYDKWDRLVLYQKGNNRSSYNGITSVQDVSTAIDLYGYEGTSYQISGSGTVTLKAAGLGGGGFEFKASSSEGFAIGSSVSVGSAEWFFVKYDKEERPVMKGTVTLTGGRAALQAVADGKTNRFESRGTTLHGYTNNTFPNGGQGVGANQVLEVFYYDSYGYPGCHAFTADPIIAYTETSTSHDGTFDQVFSRLKGVSTGSKVKVLGIEGHVWLTTTSYYDDNYRPIQVITDNYLNNGITNNKEIVSNKYDFAGNVLQTKQVHKKNGQAELVSEYRYNLDHVKSVDDVELRINNASNWVKVADYVYNDKGELTSLKNHNGNITTGYSYNIRGWTTGINNASFSQNMQYQNAATPLYNGNIAALSFTNRAQNASQHSFTYSYDTKNRLTAAQNASFGSSYSYDLNGNIQNLSRKQNGQDMDVLSHVYDAGNKLKSVNDTKGTAQTGPFEFLDYAGNSQEYAYDFNGNVSRDDNRKITAVRYNKKDLPESVNIDGQAINYVYDAAGNKLKMTIVNGDNTITTEYAGSVVYRNGGIAFMHFSNGRILSPATSPAFEYNVSDHLGNVRVVLDAAGTPLQGNNYYPFGMVMWEGIGTDNQFLYQGKELNRLTEQYDFHARMYDPALGLFLGADPQRQFHSPYNAMGNNPMMYVDPDGELAFLAVAGIGAAVGALSGYMVGRSQGAKGWNMAGYIAGGAAIGAISGGIGSTVSGATAASLGAYGSAVAGGTASGAFSGGAFSSMTGGSFAGGAWRGALTGMVGAGLGGIGVGESFGANLALGIGEGAITGALGAALYDGNVAQGALYGGIGGGAFATVTSPQLKNAFRGMGFRSNSKVLANFTATGDYQGALDYFGFEGTYDPIRAQGNPGATNRAGEVFYSESAFTNYDRLASVVQHEMYHRANMLSGKYNGIEGNLSFDLKGLEEHGGYMLNYKNQGLYRDHGFNFLERVQIFGSQGGLYDQSYLYESKWWHFIYKIPRRY